MNTSTRKLYEVAVMKNPGLKAGVKINLQLSKMNILFLARLIEVGLNPEAKKEDEMLALLPPETREELVKVKEELLKKGDLGEFYADLHQAG